MKVVIGMSGGVDSSAAAALLQRQGYEVIGVTLLTWEGSEEVERPWLDRTCCKVGVARHVAQRLGIEHHVVDAQDAFRDQVIEDFFREYEAGRTPNPCVRCNERVKFGFLLELADRFGADYLATGHYARVAFQADSGRYSLLKGEDGLKDQSYFLYRLRQPQLSRILFPLGGLQKAQVWELAESLDLPASVLAESQEICFVTQRDYRDFLLEQRPASLRGGDIVGEDGRVLGRHGGISLYTIGQRKGLGLALETGDESRRRYVTRIDAVRNQVVVGPQEDLYRQWVSIHRLNLLRSDLFQSRSEVKVTAKIRYRAAECEAVARWTGEDRLEVLFDRPQRAVTPGQSLVMYRGEDVLGGGIILDFRTTAP